MANIIVKLILSKLEKNPCELLYCIKLFLIY